MIGQIRRRFHIDRARQHFMLQGQNNLGQASHASHGLQVTNLRFDRANSDLFRSTSSSLEYVSETSQLNLGDRL